MATKPTTLPRWASVSPPTPDPGLSKQDVGWVTGERPPAKYANWLAYWSYKWAEYLKDGALQGAHTFDSTVDIAGDTTVGGSLSVGPNENVTVSGIGEFKHGDQTLAIHSWSGQYFTGTAFSFQETGVRVDYDSGFANNFRIPIPLKVGDRIKSVTISLQGGGLATTVDWQVSRYATSILTSLGVPGMSATITNPGTVADYTLTASGSGYTIPSNESLAVAITTHITTVGNYIVMGVVHVVYDRP